MGTCREGSLQLQLCLAECQPGLICKVADVLGTGKCWRTELVSLGQVCSWSSATPGCPWSIRLTAAVALALIEDDCAVLHLRKRNVTCPPGSTNRALTDWPYPGPSASPTLAALGSPLTLGARFSLTGGITHCWASQCCQPPCPDVSGYPSRVAPKHLPGDLEL